MSLRGFGGIQTLGAAATPVFGTTLAAATVLNPDFYTGNTAPGSNRSSCVVTLAAGTAGRFRQGDRVALGVAAAFEQSNTTQADGGTVTAVNAAANTITVQGLTKNHGSGEYCVLALPVASFGIQITTASSQYLYLGEDPTVSASSSTLINVITGGGATQYGLSNIINCNETQHLWLQGGAGSQFLPSFGTV